MCTKIPTLTLHIPTFGMQWNNFFKPQRHKGHKGRKESFCSLCLYGLKPHGIEIDIHIGMVAFSSSALSECQRLFERYPNRRSALLPTLWLAQREFQVITPEVSDYIGELIGIPGSDVYSAATFYTMFNKRPVGKYHLDRKSVV